LKWKKEGERHRRLQTAAFFIGNKYLSEITARYCSPNVDSFYFLALNIFTAQAPFPFSANTVLIFLGMQFAPTIYGSI
jgi:hypothetical protein